MGEPGFAFGGDEAPPAHAQMEVDEEDEEEGQFVVQSAQGSAHYEDEQDAKLCELIRTILLDQAPQDMDWETVGHSLRNLQVEEELSEHGNTLPQAQTLLESFQVLRHAFCAGFDSLESVAQRGVALFGQRIQDVGERRDQYVHIFGQFHILFERANMLYRQKQSGLMLINIFDDVARQMKLVCDVVLTSLCSLHRGDEGYTQDLSSLTLSAHFQLPDLNGMDAKAKMDYYIQYLALKHGLVKDEDGVVYELLRCEETGHSLHAYKELGDMRTFVYNSVYPISQHRYWYQQLLKCGGDHLVEHLRLVHSELFPQKKTNPLLISFGKTGLFSLEDGRFYWHDWVPGAAEKPRRVSDLKMDCLVADTHHDLPFPDDEIQEEMETRCGQDPRGTGREVGPSDYTWVECQPLTDILQSQGVQALQQFWVEAMLGRLLYPLGHKDHWHVFLLMLGLAGTGKSTLLRWVAALFNMRDVGYLANKGRDTFTIQELIGKRIWLALDIDKQWTLDQGTWNSMVAGEEVVIPVMYKGSTTVKWESPGAAAANEAMAYKDKGGNVARRLFVMEYINFVSKADPNLFQKCLKNLPRFVFRIVNSYLLMTSLLGDQVIYHHMPPRFQNSIKRVIQNMNPIGAFVQQCCEFDNAKNHRFRLARSDLRKAFLSWGQLELGYKPPVPTESEMKSIQGQYKLEYVNGALNPADKNDPAWNRDYYWGVQLREDAQRFLTDGGGAR